MDPRLNGFRVLLPDSVLAARGRWARPAIINQAMEIILSEGVLYSRTPGGKILTPFQAADFEPCSVGIIVTCVSIWASIIIGAAPPVDAIMVSYWLKRPGKIWVGSRESVDLSRLC